MSPDSSSEPHPPQTEQFPLHEAVMPNLDDNRLPPQRPTGWAEYSSARMIVREDGQLVKVDRNGNEVHYPHHLI